MRTGIRGFAAALALLGAGSASAVELNYSWKKGDVHRFRFENDTTAEMKMAGMGAAMGAMGAMGGMKMPGMDADGGMKMQMKVQSVFSQKVLGVRPDGTADMELTVERMDFFQGARKVASINDVPAWGRTVKAEVDRKGHARFYRMVTVYMQDNRWVVGVHGSASASVSHNSAKASVDTGDSSISVMASVDPRSGKVSLSMKEEKHAPAKAQKVTATKAVQVKEDDPTVDVLPREIFEMMVLPEGDVSPGSEGTLATPMGDIAFKVAEQTDKILSIHTQLAGKKMGAPEQPSDEAVAAGDDGADSEEHEAPAGDGMAMGGMNMGGMQGMPGAGGAKKGQGGMAGMGGMKNDLEVTAGFDVGAGKLLTIDGTGSSEMDMGGGGGMKTHSRFTLSRL